MAASSKYPFGWNKDRWMNDTAREFRSLTAEQNEAFYNALTAEFGEDGAAELQDEKARLLAAKDPQPPRQFKGNFLLRPNMDYFGDYPEWGFVIYRTAGYGNEDLIREVKAKIQAHVGQQFSETTPSAELEKAREKFKLIWIEGEDIKDATPEEIASRYRELTQPPGEKFSFELSHQLCLCVDEWSIASIQQESTGKAPPHVLAISTSCGEEFTGDEADDDRWTGTFKVAVTTLITELFPDLRRGRGVYAIGVGITPDLVRTDGGRFGIKKAYSDGPITPVRWKGRMHVQ